MKALSQIKTEYELLKLQINMMKIPLYSQLVNKIFPGTRSVDLSWLVQLKLQNFNNKKIKVGFGYINTGEETLGNRKWHIDPIVRHLNRHSNRYVCDIFFPKEDLSKFDIAVIVKRFGYTNENELKRLKAKNTKLIFNISDNPAGCNQDYENSRWFLNHLDRILLLNPNQGNNILDYKQKFRTIYSPIIDPRYKSDYSQRKVVKIFWDGYLNNLYTMEQFNKIILRLSKELSQEIEMIYNCNIENEDDGIIKYRKWSISNWKEMIMSADIGVVVKPVNDERQQKKPPTKIVSYMSSGLPVICTPSTADEKIIEHGKTGFFAHSDDDWYRHLRSLILDPKLREKTGVAARKYTHQHFSIEKIAALYTEIFDELC